MGACNVVTVPRTRRACGEPRYWLRIAGMRQGTQGVHQPVLLRLPAYCRAKCHKRGGNNFLRQGSARMIV